jgi:glucose-6-phosphate isomerase
MKDTPLWNFAKAHEIQTISHPDVSGRFSCFTAVAIFPALIAGVNVESYIDGGRWQSNKMLNQSFSNAMLKDDIHIIMPYTQKLSVFTEWYSQLTAESLSKNGKGYCVVRALGTKDQHNQLQMFLDGKNNKTYTFIGVNKKNANVVANTIDNISVPNAGLSCIMQAGMHGVAHELAQQGKCVRIIEFEEMTPSEVGKLFVFYMQEVLHQASILNVEPFTQPAVASVKKLMFEFLTKE